MCIGPTKSCNTWHNDRIQNRTARCCESVRYESGGLEFPEY
jgi:hypothetical protein